MPEFADDRERWNHRYLTRPTFEPSAVLVSLLGRWLEQRQQRVPGEQLHPALDLAGGDGRHGAWLQEQGWPTLVIDISRLALQRARQRSAQLQLVEAEGRGPLPFAHESFGLIVICHFLERSLMEGIADYLCVGGSLVMLHPTRRNLERHSRPPAHFLLEENELPTLLTGLNIVEYSEGWNDEGRHEALIWGERPPALGS